MCIADYKYYREHVTNGVRRYHLQSKYSVEFKFLKIHDLGYGTVDQILAV